MKIELETAASIIHHYMTGEAVMLWDIIHLKHDYENPDKKTIFVERLLNYS